MSDKASSKKRGSVMIAGGGIGGMQAALDLADSGFKVHMVEKGPSIGGTMVQLDKTFPTGDCAMCMISPKMVEVGRHENINILSMSEVTGIEGEPGNFKARLLQTSRSIDPEKCTGCGTCTKACPVHNVIQVPPKAPLPTLKPEWEDAIETTLEAHEAQRSALIAMLQSVNTSLGYLPRSVLWHMADRIGIPESEILRVASFYAQFRFTPPGKNQIKICMGTACFVRGAGLIMESVVRQLGIEEGETTKDGLFSIERVACFGSCALAPVAVVNDTVYAAMTPSKLEKLIDKLGKSDKPMNEELQ